MSNVKLGLIGCGRIARVHLDVLQKLPDAEVVAVAEADTKRREAIQDLVPGAAAFAGHRELLAVPEIDAVIITVPTWLHADVATAAVSAGKHIYLEKPLAADLSSADRLVAAWQESDVQAMIGFNYRLNPLHLEARDLLQAGRIGQVFAVRTIFASEGGELPGWLQRRETGGGALLELGSHHFDLLPYLLGSGIRDVQAVIESRRTEDDYAALTMTLEDETVVQSTFFLGARQEDRFEIYGTGGKLVIDRFRSLRVELSGDAAPQARFQRILHTLEPIMRSKLLGDDILAPRHEPSYDQALARFVDGVRQSRPPSPDLWDGRCSLAVVVSAEEAARTERKVSVPRPD
jgi:predicted dehydrogenase